MAVRLLKWIPNILSSIRAALTFPIFVAALDHNWKLGLLLVAAALLTDFLDGLAAKKFNAITTLGGHIDQVADFLLAASGFLGLMLGTTWLSPWLLVAAVPLSVYIGYVKFLTPTDTKLYQATTSISVSVLFLAWTFVVWGFLFQAFGWSWMYVPATLCLLTGAGFLKRHRLKAWFGWLFSQSQN